MCILSLLQQVVVPAHSSVATALFAHEALSSSLLSRACKFCVVERVIAVYVELRLITHVQNLKLRAQEKMVSTAEEVAVLIQRMPKGHLHLLQL